MEEPLIDSLQTPRRAQGPRRACRFLAGVLTPLAAAALLAALPVVVVRSVTACAPGTELYCGHGQLYWWVPLLLIMSATTLTGAIAILSASLDRYYTVEKANVEWASGKPVSYMNGTPFTQGDADLQSAIKTVFDRWGQQKKIKLVQGMCLERREWEERVIEATPAACFRVVSVPSGEWNGQYDSLLLARMADVGERLVMASTPVRVFATDDYVISCPAKHSCGLIRKEDNKRVGGVQSKKVFLGTRLKQIGPSEDGLKRTYVVNDADAFAAFAAMSEDVREKHNFLDGKPFTMDRDEVEPLVAYRARPTPQDVLALPTLKSKHRPLAAGLLLAGALLGFPVAVQFVYTATAGLDTSTFAVPSTAPMPDILSKCGCVAVGGILVLPTVFLGIAAIFISFAANFAFTVVRELGWHRRRLARSMSQLFWESQRVPSKPALILSYSLLAISGCWVVGSTAPRGFSAYDIKIAMWVNGGAQAATISGLLGAAMTTAMLNDELLGATKEEPYPHWSSPNGLRFFGSFLLLATLALGFLTHIIPGMVRYVWLSAASEALVASLMQCCFPEATCQLLGSAAEWWALGKDSSVPVRYRLTCLARLFVTWLFAPMLPVAARLWRFLGFKRSGSPLAPLGRALMLALVVELKVLEYQFFFNIKLLSEYGVQYLDAVVLAYQARHNACTMCLASAKVDAAVNTTVTGEAWLVDSTRYTMLTLW